MPMGLRFEGRKNDQNLAINVECRRAKGRTQQPFLSLYFRGGGKQLQAEATMLWHCIKGIACAARFLYVQIKF